MHSTYTVYIWNADEKKNDFFGTNPPNRFCHRYLFIPFSFVVEKLTMKWLDRLLLLLCSQNAYSDATNWNHIVAYMLIECICMYKVRFMAKCHYFIACGAVHAFYNVFVCVCDQKCIGSLSKT